MTDQTIDYAKMTADQAFSVFFMLTQETHHENREKLTCRYTTLGRGKANRRRGDIDYLSHDEDEIDLRITNLENKEMELSITWFQVRAGDADDVLDRAFDELGKAAEAPAPAPVDLGTVEIKPAKTVDPKDLLTRLNALKAELEALGCTVKITADAAPEPVKAERWQDDPQLMRLFGIEAASISINGDFDMPLSVAINEALGGTLDQWQGTKAEALAKLKAYFRLPTQVTPPAPKVEIRRFWAFSDDGWALAQAAAAEGFEIVHVNAEDIMFMQRINGGA